MTSDAESQESESQEVKRIRRLAELMREFELTELRLVEGDAELALSRFLGAPVAASQAGPAAAAPAPAATAAASPPVATPAASNLHVIKSPMVGTFYVASGPDAPPFVKVGDHVGPETTVCIIEAMKVFNEVPAEVAGKIAAVLIENGEPVEFGQPLFKVDPQV